MDERANKNGDVFSDTDIGKKYGLDELGPAGQRMLDLLYAEYKNGIISVQTLIDAYGIKATDLGLLNVEMDCNKAELEEKAKRDSVVEKIKQLVDEALNG